MLTVASEPGTVPNPGYKDNVNVVTPFIAGVTIVAPVPDTVSVSPLLVALTPAPERVAFPFIAFFREVARVVSVVSVDST